MGRKVLSRILMGAALLGGVAPDLARACATAPPEGDWVRVASESAIIVWDRAAKREHFIRKASFRSSTKDFGFLVPTPTKPELAEIDDAVFGKLDWATRPPIAIRTERSGVELGSLVLSTRGERASAPAPSVVRVLDEATVGGYDAVVLEADDPKALATWLTDHGYAARPALSTWLAPYVAAHWKITAFKVASPAGRAPQGTLGTRAVRMSFGTERPFFPYREPADQRADPPDAAPGGAPPAAAPSDGARSLLVYFVGPERVAASIGTTGAFPGSIPFARRVGGELPPDVAALLPGLEPVVTVITDSSSPRPGTDELYFDPSADQADIQPAPVPYVVREPFVVPIEGVLLVVGFGAFIVVLVRRTRRARAS